MFELVMGRRSTAARWLRATRPSSPTCPTPTALTGSGTRPPHPPPTRPLLLRRHVFNLIHRDISEDCFLRELYVEVVVSENSSTNGISAILQWILLILIAIFFRGLQDLASDR